VIWLRCTNGRWLGRACVQGQRMTVIAGSQAEVRRCLVRLMTNALAQAGAQ